jgi:outer membrane receptor for ferrienterochelin and colicins
MAFFKLQTMKKIITLTVALFIGSFIFAQHTITGTVQGKEKLQGVSITIKGSKKGATTDSLGNYQLKNIATGNTVLHFEFAGYETFDTTLQISSNVTLNIILPEAKEELEDVVIVASSRTNSRIEDLPTKVEVLGSEEVHEENQIKPGNIASLLGDIAGIQIQQTNAATGNADMRIQGLQGKYTQILRDGMPLFGGFSGSFGILQIPPLDLQQIELVKGAASTLYGGGAIAGMLNLVSKKPKLGTAEHSITLNTSTLKENNMNLFFSGRNKKIGYTLFGGGTLQKQVDVNKDGFSDVPSVKSTFIHPRLFAYLNQKSTLTLGYTLNYEDRNGGDMKVLDKQATATNQFFIQNKSLRNTVDVVLENKLANNANLTIKGAVNFFNRDVITKAFGMKANQTLWYSEVAYTQKVKQHNYVLGVNFNGDDFKKQLPDSALMPNEKNKTLGFFAQDDWKLSNQFTLQAGLRVDVHDNYGTFVLPRLSMMYKVNNKVTMRLGGGLGYKAPTLITSELDERDYKYIVGYRSDIEAEKSYGANYDINYKTKAGDWSLTFNQTFFYNQIDKPLSLYYQYGFIGTNPIFIQYYNEAKPLQTAGFETYIAAHKDALELYLGYVYTNAKRQYNSSNPNLPLIARNKLATVIAYEFSKNFRAGIEASYTGKQYLDNGTQTQDYLFGAAMIRYGYKNISFVLNCENLLDYRQNKNNQTVFPPYTNPRFPEIWAPLDGRVVNLSMMIKW